MRRCGIELQMRQHSTRDQMEYKLTTVVQIPVRHSIISNIDSASTKDTELTSLRKSNEKLNDLIYEQNNKRKTNMTYNEKRQ